MKILGIVLGLCLMASIALAGVEAEIVKVDFDGTVINVWTQYKVDGVEVQSRYPKITITDGEGVSKSYYVWRVGYNLFQFDGLSSEQIKTRVLKDVNEFANELGKNTYLKKANENYVSTIKATEGSKVSKDTFDLDFGTGKWTVKTDGTKVN